MFSSGFHVCMKSIDTADTGAHQGDLTAPGDTEKGGSGLPNLSLQHCHFSYIYIVDIMSIVGIY